MKRILSFIVLLHFALLQYGQIIADHTVVDKYDDIPQQYIDEVKKMLVDMPGESHAGGYRIGMNLLELLDSKFQVSLWATTPPAYTTSYLRFGGHGSVGEEDLYVTQALIDGYKTYIGSQNNTGNQYSVMGYAWCTEMYYNVTGPTSRDPVYNVSWYGESVGGPDGSRSWGLDAGDYGLTGNGVCMDSYLNAVGQFNQYISSNGFKTKFIYATGPVDNEGGSGNLEGTHQGYQREVKHDYIRAHVSQNNERILFDYADILCWNNSGQQHMTYWNDGGTIRAHTNIHPDNEKDYDASWNVISPTEDGDHIGEVGALRLAKAMWWLLARIAGWDGGVTWVEDPSVEESEIWTEIKESELKVHFPGDFLSGKSELYTLDGSLKASMQTDSDLISFDTSNLPSGLYILVIRHQTGVKSKKIILP